MKRTVFIIPILYILLWIALISLNYKAYGFIFSQFDSKVIRIHSKLQVTTGPMHYIDDIKSIKNLNKSYSGLKNYDIELVGDIPYDYIDDPAEIDNLVVYGSFNGITDKYRLIWYDEVPVFVVKYYDYPSIILGKDLYVFPIYIAVISIPIFIVIIYIFATKKHKLQH